METQKTVETNDAEKPLWKISLNFDSEDLEKSRRAPCLKCGEPSDHNEAFYRQWGAGICRKCYRAYFCALLGRSLIRACYHKKRSEGKTAAFFEERMRLSQEALDAAAAKFHRDYAVNWKAHLREVFEDCERMLGNDIGGAVETKALLREGKEKGWL